MSATISLKQLVLQGQISVKNAHTATHLLIHDNRLVLLAIQQQINIYSLSKMACKQASLVKVIPLTPLLDRIDKQLYQDNITAIFRNPQRHDLIPKLFGQHQDIRENALLKVDNIKERIRFLNRGKIKVKRMLLLQQGCIVILLCDGRAVVIREWQGLSHKQPQMVNLSKVSEQKIKDIAVAQEHICLLMADKVTLFNLNSQKTITHRLKTSEVIDQIFLSVCQDKFKIYLISTTQLSLWQLSKKRITMGKVLLLDQPITQVFNIQQQFFIITTSFLYKSDASLLQAIIIQQWQHPTQLLLIDKFCNYTAKSIANQQQSIWLAANTTNHIAVILTIRKNANYKEGKLLVMQPSLSYYLRHMLSHIKGNHTINLKDAILIPRNKQNKQILHQFSPFNQSYIYQGIQLTQQQYLVASINIGHAFDGKQQAIIKMVEKVLQLKFPTIQREELMLRCCFSGKKIMDQQLVYCEECGLYGIKGGGYKCVGCYRKMQNYIQ